MGEIAEWRQKTDKRLFEILVLLIQYKVLNLENILFKK